MFDAFAGEKPDPFGIFIGLIVHKMSNGDCDELTNPRLFPRRLNEIWAKVELAVDENFGGNWTDFFMAVLTREDVVVIERKELMIEIERWLNQLLLASAELYPEI